MLAIFIAALKQSKTGKRDSVGDVWKAVAKRRTSGEGKASKPVQEEDSSDHLVGIGPGASSPHLLPVQVVKHTLPKESQSQVM